MGKEPGREIGKRTRGKQVGKELERVKEAGKEERERGNSLE